MQYTSTTLYLQGGGTRKGSGACRCDTGYAGEFCDKCKVGYYNNTPNEDSWECTKCDKACKGHCREGGPKGCEVCADGYQYSTEFGCIGNYLFFIGLITAQNTCHAYYILVKNLP